MFSIFINYPVSALLGVAAFIGCISMFGGWGIVAFIPILWLLVALTRSGEKE